jgi:hypothetical protein
MNEEETPEAPPPETGLFSGPPAGETGDYDQWGNLRLQAEKIIEENHGQNFIKIFIYKYNGRFFYGFQIRIEKLVRQKRANINDPPMQSTEAAGEAARKQIIGICKTGHAIKKLFNDFTVIQYNQPELF